ncbi:hypothetical protein CCMSSC00406_0006057 [Pleurotus cornucopiae]|uniref:Uncharacterized protein n=1 Tax=Pleurotus cornucopiae TaxID=5321 RepID=A0ACB7IRD1_PLECO|nr:hypothetical protein CCMSSC00406_0006057 [Pleurotus cornucopiae]
MKSFAIIASLAAGAQAHSIFQELYVNGVSAGHTVGIRVPDYDGPITDVTSNDVICNGGINPYHQPVSQTIIPVPAGATVTAEWHHTLSGATPIQLTPATRVQSFPTCKAKVNNATQTDVTGLKWFKIYQDGLDTSTNTWGVDRLIANAGKVSFKIPSCIEPGQYLLRHELIALHAAGSYPGAQLYMECAQIQITGGGSTAPSPTVNFPGAYAGSDPGISINIYQTLSGYTIPGPSVFTC